MSRLPRYTPNAAKALEAILWITSKCPGFDVYHVVKSAFFADKKHIVEYGRPIVGDNYDAAPFGPLPQVVYGLLRGDPIEVLALESNGYIPFRVDDKHVVSPERGPNLRLLSRSDIDALEYAVSHVDGRSFGDIFDETHSDPAYSRAVGRMMDYRDFIPDDDPDHDDKVADIEETAALAVI